MIYNWLIILDRYLFKISFILSGNLIVKSEKPEFTENFIENLSDKIPHFYWINSN